jgi:hypothetical protein
MTDELWIENDVEGSDRGLILGTIPVFAWRNWGKHNLPPPPREDIQTRVLPHTKHM